MYNGEALTSTIASFRALDYKWWAFTAIAVGMFGTLVDQTSVNLALPRIADHFDSTIPAVQWIALGYILVTGSLLLPMGRLSDMIGRRRVYTAGFVIFIAGAALTGSAPSLFGLILFKLFQGIGAAMIQANAMAIMTSAFPGRERGKAIGLFMMIVGLGAIVGPTVGGALVGLLGWRAVFFMGVPFGIVSIVAAMLILRAESAPTLNGRTRRLRFDWLGALLSAATLAIFLLVMTNAYRVGWGSPIIMAGLGSAGMLLAIFIWWERRTPDPMLAMELFKHRLFSVGITAAFFSFMVGTSIYYLMPFYVQDVLGFSPLQAGLILTPVALSYGLSGPIAGRLSDLYGWRRFAIAGLVILLASLVIFVRLTTTTPVWVVIVGLVMQGVGMGTFYSPNASAVLSVVNRSSYGIATAFLNLVRNTATMTGLGLATTIFTAVMVSSGFEPSLDAVGSAEDGEGVKAAFTEGLRTVYMVGAGLTVIAIILTTIQGKAATAEDVASETDQQMPSRV